MTLVVVESPFDIMIIKRVEIPIAKATELGGFEVFFI